MVAALEVQVANICHVLRNWGQLIDFIIIIKENKHKNNNKNVHECDLNNKIIQNKKVPATFVRNKTKSIELRHFLEHIVHEACPREKLSQIIISYLPNIFTFFFLFNDYRSYRPGSRMNKWIFALTTLIEKSNKVIKMVKFKLGAMVLLYMYLQSLMVLTLRAVSCHGYIALLPLRSFIIDVVDLKRQNKNALSMWLLRNLFIYLFRFIGWRLGSKQIWSRWMAFLAPK